MTGSAPWIPGDRLLAIIDKNGRPSLGKQSPVYRTLNRLRTGEQRFVSLDFADRCLIQLGLEDHWHYRREDGGLADIYEDGADYGNPNRRVVAA